MPARIAFATSVLVVLLCAPASGKGLEEVKVCGADGCVDRTARASDAVIEGGPRASAPRGPAPYYVLRLGFGADGRVVHGLDKQWVPRAGLLRDGGVWMRPTARVRRALRRVTRGIAPRPAGSPPPAPLPAPPHGQLPPDVMEPPPVAEEGRSGRGGGPSAALVAAPAALVLGLAALAARRRRGRA